MDDQLRALAREAGIEIDWIDAYDKPQRVSISSLRSVLGALGLPCATAAQIVESRKRLRELAGEARSVFTVTAGKPIVVGTMHLPGIDKPGYHHLHVEGRDLVVAVAPPRCVTLEDIAPGERLYGIAVQLYALRRAGDDGFGDTGALTELVAGAARQGAEAIALSPTHSLFPADPSHYAPYSPSSRLFLNPLYADPAIVFGADRVAAARGDAPRSEDTLNSLAQRRARQIRVVTPPPRRFCRARLCSAG